MFIATTRNPQFNSNINPRLNSSINPQFNSLINPQFNTLINPQFNSLINPLFNTLINPLYNTLINPQLNTLINPQLNTLINPKFNTLINPQFNVNFAGMYVFDLNLNPVEFIILANNEVILFYDFNLQNTRYGVPHSQNGFVIFNNNNISIGHLESDSKNGYNEFTMQNIWIKIIK